MDPNIQRLLREVDWADIGIRLTAYAVWKARNFRWRTHQEWALAAGMTPEDVARDAILKLLEGRRAWDPQRGALLPYLEGVVDSLMSHLAGSQDNVLLAPLAVGEHAYARRAPALDDPAPDDQLERLRAVLVRRDHGQLIEILDAAQVCGPTPAAIARHLKTPVADINNRLKRLRRLALQLRSVAATQEGT